MQQNIVIFVDYSLASEKLLTFYLERLHRSGNKLVLVHCIPLPECSIDKARDNHISPAILEQLWKDEEVKRTALEEKFRNYLKEKEVHGTLRSACGKRRDVICRIVNEVGAAFVVVNDNLSSSGSFSGKVWRAVTNGATGRRLSGSDLIDHLLRNLPCPLVVVKSSPTVGSDMEASKARTTDRPRHFSGEAVANLTSRIRRIRFASGGTGVAVLKGSGASSASLVSGGNRSICYGVTDL